MKKVKYLVVTSPNSESLNKKVRKLIEEGWEPKGSHTVVEKHRQNRFSGKVIMDTVITSEYSQTMITTEEEELTSETLQENKLTSDKLLSALNDRGFTGHTIDEAAKVFCEEKINEYWVDSPENTWGKEEKDFNEKFIKFKDLLKHVEKKLLSKI